MTLYPPLLLEAVTGDTAITYHAQDFRNMISALAPNAGVVLAADLTVSQRGAGANMSVDVAAGRAVIPGGSIANQGTYIVRSDATANVTITAANATNPRIDLIVATVKDKQSDGGTTYGWVLQAIAGTPAASPSAPALPVSSIPLAQVAVAANATSVTTSNITDKRTLAGSGDVPKWELAGTGSTPQSIPNNSTTRYIPATTVQQVGVSTANMNTGEVQIQTPGRYVVHFGFRLPSAAAAYNRTAYARRTSSDGTTILRQIAQDATSQLGGAISASGSMYCNAGDRISALFYQASGGGLSLDDSNKETAFTGVWVGA